MFSYLWNEIFYRPLYNVLILLVAVLPGQSVGFAIIVLTFLVKLIMYPLSGKSIRAQQAMRELEPELRKIREIHKNDSQLQAKKTMELYKERKVNPLSGCLPILVQIPVIIALYWIFWKGLSVQPELLYGLTPAPPSLELHFLIFDLSSKSLLLAVLAGFTQYIQTDISLGKQAPLPKNTSGKPSFQEDFARSMQMQMRYVFPVLISFFAYTLPSAVALYWTVSNILGIGQEYLLRRNAKKS